MRSPSPYSPSDTAPKQAFTLIELLVVISIIAVLAGILLPVGNKVIENARRVSAKSTMLQFVTAVKSYQTEYGTYPVSTTTAAGADVTFDTTGASGTGQGGHNLNLFDVLRAKNSTNSDKDIAAMNPRRITYFEYKDAKNATAPRDGFVPAAVSGGGGAAAPAPKDPKGVTLKEGDLVDPWGNMYAIRIDSGYSDKVMDPYKSTTPDDAAAADDSQVVRTPVIAWAIGKDSLLWDGKTGTFEASGNVATWR